MDSIRKVWILIVLLCGATPLTGADTFAEAVRDANQFRASGNFERAHETLNLAFDLAANDTERALARAKQAEIQSVDLKDHVAARRTSQEALDFEQAAAPAKVIALQTLARCQMQADRDHLSAIENLKRASELPDVSWAQPVVHLMLGDCYRATKRPEKAIEIFTRISRMKEAGDDIKAVARLNIGMTYQYDLRQPGRAGSHYDAAIKLSPNLARQIIKHRAEFAGAKPSPLVMTHYMPWYAAAPHDDRWGWHWTMNHFDPNVVVNGKRQIAARHYPAIGPYDSGDRDVIEYQLLLMKLAGIDGVIVDWYGLQNFRDYSTLHRNTQRMIDQVERLGLRLVICYEDQTITTLEKAGRITSEERVAHAAAEIDWLADHWFKLDSYVRDRGKPVLMSFGHNGLSDEEWRQCLDRVAPVAYLSQQMRRSSAVGGFDWPAPQRGLKQQRGFIVDAASWERSVPVVFPRFHDIYGEAKVRTGFPVIGDKDGKTFRDTLRIALDSDPFMIQIATWNDWGEGTQIEPSLEFGDRDLRTLQNVRRERFDSNFAANENDLPLASDLLKLRRSGHPQDELNEISRLIAYGRWGEARKSIDAITER